MRKVLNKCFREGIKALIRQDKRAWWELKKEFDNGGYSHTAFGHYYLPARSLVKHSLTKYFEELASEYVGTTGKQQDTEEMAVYFGNLIVGEIFRRAEVAARTTRNW